MTTSQIMRWVLLAAVLAAAGIFGWQRFHGTDQAAQADNAQKAARNAAVPVTIAPVEKADFPVLLTGLGTVQGFNTVVVRTRVDGQIDKIAFKEGDLVKQGDLLVADRSRARSRPRSTRPKPRSNRMRPTSPTPIWICSASQNSANSPPGSRPTPSAPRWRSSPRRSRPTMRAIFNAQTQLDYASVKAPISGVAGLRQVDVGNIVNASTQTGIVTIAQIEPIAVIFTAPEGQLPYINEAQAKQPLKVIALTTDGKKQLSEGALSVINNQVDTTSGTIRLKAVFDNKDHALWPGQSVSTRLLVTTLKDATVAPDDAVQHGTDGLYAFAVNADNKAELRKLKVANSIDGRTVIEDGLKPGERVIVAGQYKVQPGIVVATKVANSDAAPAAAKAD